MKNILVIACGPFDYGTLQQKYFCDQYRFHFEEITTDPKDVKDFISYIIDKYRDREIAGIIGTHDSPESLLAGILSKEMGLAGMDPAVAFVCEHKYYSREAQHKIIPFAVPEFQLLPVSCLKKEDITLSFPFFVKPVKSAFSMLARTVDSFEELESFLPRVEARLKTSLPAFNILLKKYSPLELDATFLLAEKSLEGVQVTVEGYSWDQQVAVMGISDSIMYPDTMSFERFEYPSRLPQVVRQRMKDIAEKLILEIGLDQAMFNIEMFYDYSTDDIHVVEINPRMSYQFADIFEKVDGTNSYDIQLQISQGNRPHFEIGQGQFGTAASFVLRLFEDMLVTRVPTEQEISQAQAVFPDALIIIKVTEGNLLSDVSQDEKSYRYAIINMGGKDWTDLYCRFEALKQLLRFEFKPLKSRPSRDLPAGVPKTSSYPDLLGQFKSVGFFGEREQMISVLRDVFEVLNKHQVRTSIMFGTLLGKLQHNDFIPWDDDVDLIIFDYDAFLDLCVPALEQQGYSCEPDMRGSKRTGCRIFHQTGAQVDGKPELRFPWIGVYEHEIGEDGLIVLPPEKARYRPDDFFPLKQTDLLGIPIAVPQNPEAILNCNFQSEDWMEYCQLAYRDHRNGNVPTGLPSYKFELDRVLEYLSANPHTSANDSTI